MMEECECRRFTRHLLARLTSNLLLLRKGLKRWQLDLRRVGIEKRKDDLIQLIRQQDNVWMDKTVTVRRSISDGNGYGVERGSWKTEKGDASS